MDKVKGISVNKRIVAQDKALILSRIQGIQLIGFKLSLSNSLKDNLKKFTAFGAATISEASNFSQLR